MDKFIKLLLEKESTVILPNFGAIVIENESTGKLMFNEYLKFNDGKLDAIIVANSNMNIQEAQNAVAKYVREIQQELDKGNQYSIYGLGSLAKDKDGDIVFVNTKNQVNQNTPEDTVQGPSPTPPKTEKKENADTQQDNDIHKNSDAEKEIKPDRNKKNTDATEGRISPSEDSSGEDKERDTKSKKVTKSKETKDSEQKTEPSKKKQKKKRKPILLIVIILILAAFGTGGLLIATNYDDFKAFMGWDKFDDVKSPQEILAEAEQADIDKEEELDESLAVEEQDLEEASETDMDSAAALQEEEPVSEPAMEEAIVVEEPEIVEEPKPRAVEPASTSGNYFLIAGTFTEKNNAETLVNELKAKGHPAQIIGFFNNMHYVSIAAFSSRGEASQAVSGIQNDAPGAWIYKKP